MSEVRDFIGISIDGHCKMVDDLGNVLLDKHNAIHPQNMARVFARALSHEDNHFIKRIAFGNGGTTVDAAFTVTYRTPNDGQPPDVRTWDSRLYKETYSEIIDDLDPLIGTDPGSAELGNIRPGGGAVPSSDPVSIPNVSGPGVRSREVGLLSEVVIEAVLNGNEPRGQLLTDTNPPAENTEQDFVFDELGLYSGGAPAADTTGYVQIDVGNRTTESTTGLVPSTTYQFTLTVDGGSPIVYKFTTPASGSGPLGEILYGDFCQAFNGAVVWTYAGPPLGVGEVTFNGTPPANVRVKITDGSNGAFSTVVGAQTYGFLQFESLTTGPTSTVAITNATAFLSALNPPLGATAQPAVAGVSAGIQNDPTQPTIERERLLAHLIFSPVLKARNRTLTLTYTLTISVARSPTA